MKKIIVFLIALTILACTSKLTEPMTEQMTEPIVAKEMLTSTLYTLSEKGIGKEVGIISIVDMGDKGIVIEVDATNLIPGVHGFHMHEKSTLTPSTTPDGKVVIAGGAGGHWDPDKTGKHLGPNGNGHRGDLPKLTVNKDGKINMKVESSKIFIEDVSGKSLMIHVKGDNYADTPTILGGGGSRLYAAPF